MGVYTFTQDNLIIPLCEVNASVVGNTELNSFNMKGYDQATIIMQFSASVQLNNVLTLECASSDGGDTKDATFHYRLNSSSAAALASSDVLAADATASTLTLTAATYQGHMLVLELHADSLPTASGEIVYPWVTVDFDGTASIGTIAAFAILSKPRYAKAVMPTAI